MSRRAQVKQQDEEAAKKELLELKKEEAALEKDLDGALKKAEYTEDAEEAAKQNLIADNIESDLVDLKVEIDETKEQAGIIDQPSQQDDDKQAK